MPYRTTDSSDARHVVTAVLVAHDGSRWLPDALSALRTQERPVQRLVVADTGSRDTTPDVLAEHVDEASVVRLPRTTGFGAAVSGALDLVESAPDEGPDVVEWVWILHDDCAPQPDALAQLLEVAETSPSAAVLGPKIRGWYDRTRLVEVGVTMSGSGRRETGLERGEQDQGQHDGIREVLAVSTAGMLVRREVFDRLGGFDPALPIFRDDVDFCWRVNLAGHRVLVVPDAVVHHAEAASHSRRRISSGRSHRHLTDRRNALYVLLANLPARALPLAYLRLLVVSVFRVLGFVLAKRVGYALDEVLALLLVLGRPGRVWAARRARKRHGPLQHRAARHLLASPGMQVRHVLEVVTGVVTGRRDAMERPAVREGVETGPSPEDAENLALEEGDWLRRMLGRPGLLLFSGLLLLTLVATRELLWGGTLRGGALLPAPAGASDLWASYTASWHAVGIGSAEPSAPYVGVLAVLSSLLLGKAGLVVDVLMLGSVPLAGWTAYRASTVVVESRVIRVWGAAAYALLPAATGAVAAGRMGTATAVVLLPLLARLLLRTAGLASKPAAPNTPWAAGALLAVTTAFVPVAYVLAVLLGVVAFVSLRGRDLARRVAVVLVVPPVVLLPWSLAVLSRPSLLLTEAGLTSPDLSDSRLNPFALLMLHPGGPGMYRAVLTVGIVLAAAASLLRSTRRGVLVGGWAVALVALGVGLVMSRLSVTGLSAATPVAPWPGFPTAVAGAALVVVAAVGAEGAYERLGSLGFSWRQPVAVSLAVVAGLTPLVAAAAWVVRGADGPLERRGAEVLPAYVAAEADTPRRTRTLVVQREQDHVRYALVRGAGPRLGDAEAGPRQETSRRLDDVVADIMSSRGGGDEAERLASFAVRYVMLTGAVDPDVVETLDSVPGMDRVSTERHSALWKLRGSPSRLTLDSAGRRTGGAPIPSDEVGAEAEVPAGEPGRLLVLSEQQDDGWTATVDGREVRPVTVDGWAQGFEMPESGGRLTLTHDGGGVRWYVVQAVLVFAALVMALPGARVDEEEAATPESSTGPRSRARGRRSAPSGRTGTRSAGRAGGSRGRRRAGRAAGGKAPAARSRRRT